MNVGHTTLVSVVSFTMENENERNKHVSNEIKIKPFFSFSFGFFRRFYIVYIMQKQRVALQRLFSTVTIYFGCCCFFLFLYTLFVSFFASKNISFQTVRWSNFDGNSKHTSKNNVKHFPHRRSFVRWMVDGVCDI